MRRRGAFFGLPEGCFRRSITGNSALVIAAEFSTEGFRTGDVGPLRKRPNLNEVLASPGVYAWE